MDMGKGGLDGQGNMVLGDSELKAVGEIERNRLGMMVEMIEKDLDNPRKRRVWALALASDFQLFIGVFHWYMTRQAFTFREFHYRLIRRLEEFVFAPVGKPPKNLYVGIPPRFGKTQIMTYFVAWGYVHNHGANFVLTSYGDRLVLTTSKAVRSIIESEIYQKLFRITIDPSESGADLWKLRHGGKFRAATLQGVVTGFGAGTAAPGFGGAMIIDDYMKAVSSGSAAEKKAVVDAYNQGLKSRLNRSDTPVIIIAQRLAVDDLIGYIEGNERENWDFLIVKGLNEETNEATWEERMSAEKLLKMKEQTPSVFYSQYQQSPIVIGGAVFKSEWWSYYRLGDGAKYKRMYITADTAMKTKERSDFTAIGCFGVTYGGEIRLLDMVHGKFEAPDLERVFTEFWNRWKNKGNGLGARCSAVYVEDKASGIGLIQSMRRKGMPIIPLKATRDKYTRALEALPSIASGNFKLPDGPTNEISKKVLAEAEQFSADMSHLHDDIIDMLCYGIEKAQHRAGII